MNFSSVKISCKIIKVNAFILIYVTGLQDYSSFVILRRRKAYQSLHLK